MENPHYFKICKIIYKHNYCSFCLVYYIKAYISSPKEESLLLAGSFWKGIKRCFQRSILKKMVKINIWLCLMGNFILCWRNIKMLIFMSSFNIWTLCVFHVPSGMWMPTLLEGSIVLRFWGRQEGICVCSQICGDVEKVRQRGFFYSSLSH